MSDCDIKLPGLLIRGRNRIPKKRIRDVFKVEAKPEIYIPSKFTSNGRPKSQGHPSKITHLQHVTHTPEVNLISSVKGFHKLKGRPKKAQLYFYDDDHRVRVATWKLEKDGYHHLGIRKCQSCGSNDHDSEDDEPSEDDDPSEENKPCEHGSCCTYDADFFTSTGNPLVRFSKRTCYRFSTDPSSCNGRRCYCIDSVLPGTYVWFGVAPVENGHLDDSMTSIYGKWSYVVSLPSLLQRYKDQFGEPVFRCGGTLHYQREICYIVLITREDDGIHGDETYPRLTADSSGPDCVFDCSRLLDSSGHAINLEKFSANAPIFRPAHAQDWKNGDQTLWDHVVFAIHVPDRMELILHDRDLLMGDPIEVEHTYCSRFKYLGPKSIDACEDIEKRYDEENSSSDVDSSEENSSSDSSEEYSNSNSSEEYSSSNSSEEYSSSDDLGNEHFDQCNRMERKYSASVSTADEKLSDSEKQHAKTSTSAFESKSQKRNDYYNISDGDDYSSDGDDDFISDDEDEIHPIISDPRKSKNPFIKY